MNQLDKPQCTSCYRQAKAQNVMNLERSTNNRFGNVLLFKRHHSISLVEATDETQIDTDELDSPLSRYLCKSVFHLWLIALMLSPLSLFAQETNRSVADSDRDSLVRATRIMRKIDRDGNGTFEKSENDAAWRRYRTLDANRDKVISMEELRKERTAYLESGGERKLNLVYKQISERNLLLDLYYPTNQTTAAGSPHPVIIYTHGGGWAAGSKQGIANGSFKAVFEKLLDHGFAVASVNPLFNNPPASSIPSRL